MMDHPALSSANLPAHLVKRIDHVAIVVHSIEQALGFYCDLLGMQPSAIKTLGVWNSGETRLTNWPGSRLNP